MITPGLFQHYKGPRYRVLFVVEWEARHAPAADAELFAVVGPIGTVPEGPAKLTVIGADDPIQFYEPVLRVRWSGNTSAVRTGDRVVIYVSLSEHGRISARTEKEFEEEVNVPCACDCGKIQSFPRFERIGE